MGYFGLKLVNQAQICSNSLNRIARPPRRAAVEEIIHLERGVQLLVVRVDRTQATIEKSGQRFIPCLPLCHAASAVDDGGFKANLILQIEKGLVADFGRGNVVHGAPIQAGGRSQGSKGADLPTKAVLKLPTLPASRS